MTTTADTIVGERVMLELFRRKLTQRSLAETLDISEGSVGKKINGVSTFSLDELITLARHFGIPVVDLLPGDDYAPVLTGRGRKGRRDGLVRHVGLEPTTRWIRVFAGHDSAVVAACDSAAELATVLPFPRPVVERVERVPA